MRAGIVLLAIAIAAFLFLSAPLVRAEPGPIQLVSKSGTEQADVGEAPALSADGRYLAFQGTIDGLSGVFREDLASGALAPVAAGTTFPPGAGADAAAPSISADGRYVSFTTAAQLDPGDDAQAGSRDVYVADMSASPPTYELASALDGSTQSIGGESTASPRVALAADGRKVVFVNGGQVYLRDLGTDVTTLVSVARDPASGEMEPGVPVPGGAVLEKPSMPLAKGAALSADGTTVAWLATNLPAQVPLLSDEAAAIAKDDATEFPYDEPLWRRVADGPSAPTRRIVGGGDPLAPGCPENGTLADPACQGPFPGIFTKGPQNAAEGWLGSEGAINGVPQLSADGREVALIGNPTEATNVFLVDMAPGLSRVQALRQLTRQVPVRPGEEGGVANHEPFVPLNGHIWDLAISAGAGRILFATARQQFPLAPPNLVTQPPSQLGLVELYLLDLETESLRRISHGDGGPGEASLGPGAGASGDGARSPSLDASGHLLAFASTAVNLVEGDGNDASDVFLVHETGGDSRAGAVSISTPPRGSRVKRGHRLALSAFSLPDGDVRLIAVVPRAGWLRARAASALAVGARPRRLATTRRRARGGGPVAMTLALPRSLAHLARSREGVYATARVAFRGSKGGPLLGKLQVRFHVHPAKRKRGRR
jgi:hypothetical protein